MSSQNKTSLSTLSERLGRAAGNVLERLRRNAGELWKRYRTYAERRREEQEQKRQRHRMRKAIYRRQLLQMLIFSAAYWGVVWLVLNSYDLQAIAEEIIKELFYLIPGEQYLSDISAMLLIVYVAVMIIWPMAALRRTTGYLDSIHLAADGILDRQNELPALPARINEIDLQLRSIRLSVIQNEQYAKEAEQRKNDLVVYLAHDLKTPLSSVIGYLTLLEELPDIPTEQRAKYTSIALDKAYRLEQLINEFFDITRFNLQSVELERNRIDLAMMLMQIADEFYPVLEEKGLSIDLKLPGKLTAVGDADKLMRVFDNLLRNAVSYSYENTQVLLALRRTEDKAEIICRNRGDQIPPQSLERLFEKFFRADSARHSGSGGSGLGLAIAKQIVELHGGEITAQSNPQYTQFTVIIPLRS